MCEDEKRKELNKFFTKYYGYFTEKAKTIHRQKLGMTSNPDKHFELVNDMYLYIMDKRMDFCYSLLQKSEKDLREFLKAIIYNWCNYPSSTFIKKEKKYSDINRPTDFADMEHYTDPLLVIDMEKDEMILELQLKESAQIDRIFGIILDRNLVEWYEAEIFMEFIKSKNNSIPKLSRDYGLSINMLWRIIDHVRWVIIDILKEEDNYDMQGRKGREKKVGKTQ
jgi:uncharacterized protein YdiU (UPF0061 family)